MVDRTQEKTHSVVGDVKSALKGVKGAGDAIRGTVNESVDTAFQDGEGEALNKSVKEKGFANMDATEDHFSRRPATGAHTGPNTGGVAGIQQREPTFTDRNTTGAGTHTGLSTGGVAGTDTREPTFTDGTTTGAGAHSSGVGNMSSHIPQQDLGGEPARATQRY